MRRKRLGNERRRGLEGLEFFYGGEKTILSLYVGVAAFIVSLLAVVALGALLPVSGS